MNAPSGKAHRLGTVFESVETAGVDVQFSDGEVLRLRSFVALDVSVYGQVDGWSAEIVACISSRRGRLFRPGNGIDFQESDVVAVQDPVRGQVLYSRNLNSPGRLRNGG